MPAAPKPAPKEKKVRKPLRSKTWLSDGPRKPLKKSGQTKAKKVIRQKEFYASATWRKLKKEAKERAGQRCEYVEHYGAHPSHQWLHPECFRCPETAKLHVHHLTNVRFGGCELPENLIVYCKYHHELVEARDHPTRKRR